VPAASKSIRLVNASVLVEGRGQHRRFTTGFKENQSGDFEVCSALGAERIRDCDKNETYLP
jgi:hypothetical protein